MSRLGDAIIRSQKALETGLGSPTVTIGAVSYVCAPSTLKRGNVLVIGGKEVTVALTFLVRRAVLATAPGIGTTLTHSSTTYRVASVSTIAGGSHWEIDVTAPNA